jgi:hypothetical protein
LTVYRVGSVRGISFDAQVSVLFMGVTFSVDINSGTGLNSLSIGYIWVLCIYLVQTSKYLKSFYNSSSTFYRVRVAKSFRKGKHIVWYPLCLFNNRSQDVMKSATDNSAHLLVCIIVVGFVFISKFFYGYNCLSVVSQFRSGCTFSLEYA